MKTELTLRLEKGAEKALLEGFPWVFQKEFIESSEQLFATPGELVTLVSNRGEFIGIGTFNTRATIACRLLTRKKEAIDTAWFENKLRKALTKREAAIEVPYYRLIHAEADGIPGLVIDRFGEVIVVQSSTAGMDLLQSFWLEALKRVIAPRGIALRNDIAARKQEDVPQSAGVIDGLIAPFMHVEENGCIYLADLVAGQKTGWFYDQRDNRKLVAEYATGKTVLDVYSHSGGFGLLAALRGATQVAMVDSSALALEIAEKAALLNKVEDKCTTLKGDAFAVMQKLAAQNKIYDIVVSDPPAFVKSKKDIESGMKGYTKVARYSAALVAPGGLLFIAACSHHASPERFANAVKDGLKQAGRQGEILKRTGAAADHPVHPALPQSAYLKGLLIKLA